MLKTSWGVPGIDEAKNWDNLFGRMKNEGVSGMEMIVPIFKIPGMT